MSDLKLPSAAVEAAAKAMERFIEPNDEAVALNLAATHQEVAEAAIHAFLDAMPRFTSVRTAGCLHRAEQAEAQRDALASALRELVEAATPLTRGANGRANWDYFLGAYSKARVALDALEGSS